MNPQLKTALLLILGVVAIAGLIAAIIYLRQRLFTKTEPIVLSS
jgi:hypothetical protein